MSNKLNIGMDKIKSNQESDEVFSFSADDFDFKEDANKVELNQEEISISLTNKKPKYALIDFLQTAVLDEPYTLIYHGSFDGAKNHIQGMRVALSRFRAQVIKKGKTLDHFYILTDSITQESDTKCKIVLLKTYQRKKFKETKILDVLEFLTIKD